MTPSNQTRNPALGPTHHHPSAHHSPPSHFPHQRQISSSYRHVQSVSSVWTRPPASSPSSANTSSTAPASKSGEVAVAPSAATPKTTAYQAVSVPAVHSTTPKTYAASVAPIRISGSASSAAT